MDLIRILLLHLLRGPLFELERRLERARQQMQRAIGRDLRPLWSSAHVSLDSFMFSSNCTTSSVVFRSRIEGSGLKSHLEMFVMNHRTLPRPPHLCRFAALGPPWLCSHPRPSARRSCSPSTPRWQAPSSACASAGLGVPDLSRFLLETVAQRR